MKTEQELTPEEIVTRLYDSKILHDYKDGKFDFRIAGEKIAALLTKQKKQSQANDVEWLRKQLELSENNLGDAAKEIQSIKQANAEYAGRLRYIAHCADLNAKDGKKWKQTWIEIAELARELLSKHDK